MTPEHIAQIEADARAACARITKLVGDAFDAPEADPMHAKPLLVEVVLSGVLMVQGIARLQATMDDIRDHLVAGKALIR